MRLQVESTTASPSSSLGQPLGERTAGVQVQRDALAQLDRCSVVRNACEGQLHEAKWVRGRTIATSAKPARIRSAAAAAAPALVPEDEQRAVVREDHERHRHRGVEVAAFEACGADADPERQEDDRAEDRARREPVERLERRHADTKDTLARGASASVPARRRARPSRQRASGRRRRRASARRGSRGRRRSARSRRAPCRRRPRRARAARPRSASRSGRAAGSEACSPRSGRRRRRARRRG